MTVLRLAPKSEESNDKQKMIMGFVKSDLEMEEKYYRRAAFVSVLFCTAAIVVCGVCLPLVYNHVQYVQTVLQDETNYCMGKSTDLWKQYSNLMYSGAIRKLNLKKVARSRQARSSGGTWSFGKFVPDWGTLLYDDISDNPAGDQAALILPPAGQEIGVPSAPAVIPPSFPRPPIRGSNILEFSESADDEEDSINGFVQSFGEQLSNFGEPFPKFPIPNTFPQNNGRDGQCCTCHQGPVGPPGQEGRPGEDGLDGEGGLMGPNGQPAPPGATMAPFPDCSTCADPVPGRPGPSGRPGRPGSPGNPGDDGTGGSSGNPGLPGNAGFKGTPGAQGGPGLPGSPGIQLSNGGAPPGPEGIPGFPGDPGNSGPPGTEGGSRGGGIPGLPGDPGDAGTDGTPGIPGNDGPTGTRGFPGDCSSCPPARLATGY